MKIYVAGPMSGIPNGNLASFRFAEAMLKAKGHEAVVPADLPPWPHDEECPPGPRAEGSPHSAPCHLRVDVAALVACDGAVFLDGWQHSAGARLEMAVAAQCALDILFIDAEGDVTYPDGAYLERA